MFPVFVFVIIGCIFLTPGRCDRLHEQSINIVNLFIKPWLSFTIKLENYEFEKICSATFHVLWLYTRSCVCGSGKNDILIISLSLNSLTEVCLGLINQRQSFVQFHVQDLTFCYLCITNQQPNILTCLCIADTLGREIKAKRWRTSGDWCWFCWKRSSALRIKHRCRVKWTFMPREAFVAFES